MPQNNCNKVLQELNELKTVQNNSQTALKNAQKVLFNIYTYENGLSVEHYSRIEEALRLADI